MPDSANSISRRHYLYTVSNARAEMSFTCACRKRLGAYTWEGVYDLMVAHLEEVRSEERIVDGSVVQIREMRHPRDGETGLVVCAGQTSAHVKFKDSADSLCFSLKSLSKER